MYDCASQVINSRDHRRTLETDVCIGAKTYLRDNLTVELDTDDVVITFGRVFMLSSRVAVVRSDRPRRRRRTASGPRAKSTVDVLSGAGGRRRRPRCHRQRTSLALHVLKCGLCSPVCARAARRCLSWAPRRLRGRSLNDALPLFAPCVAYEVPSADYGLSVVERPIDR